MSIFFHPIKNNAGDTSGLSSVVFMDYEALFWGLLNGYGETPDMQQLINDIKKRGKIDKIKVFANFSRPEIKNELGKIRTITNDIINCQNTRDSKKDITDFIMLDHIYQIISSQPELDQYILVTGDGHFSSVATFLRTYKDKPVGIYAVQGTVSNQLINCSSWALEIRMDYNSMLYYQKKIIKTLYEAESKGIIPSFRKSVEAAAKYYGDDAVKISAALSKLINNGYILQIEKDFPNGTIKALYPQWSYINSYLAKAEEAEAEATEEYTLKAYT